MEDLEWLLDWFSKNKQRVRFYGATPINDIPLTHLRNRIAMLSFTLRTDFPEYAERLFELKDELVTNNLMVNVATYARISEATSIINILMSGAKINKWNSIHRSFQNAVKQKFLLELYKESEDEAISIIMRRLKDINNSISGEEIDIEGTQLVEKLFSEKNPQILLYDIGSKTGENIQRGYSLLFRGWVYALRNRNSHLGIYNITDITSFRELEFMSMLMDTLDNRVSPPLLDCEKL